MNTELIKKLEESIDTIEKFHSVKVGEFVIGKSRSNSRITVDGYLNYKTMNDIPKSIIKSELQKVKERFNQLMNESQTFREYAINKGIDYYLDLDTGNAGIAVCIEIKGEYKEFI